MSLGAPGVEWGWSGFGSPTLGWPRNRAEPPGGNPEQVPAGDGVQFSSIQSLSCVWLFATLWDAAARPSCPSPTPRVYSNSCPLSWWCHRTISSCVVPFSSRLQSFPASGLFKWVSSLHQVAKVLDLQLQHQFFQWIFRIDFFSDWLAGSLCSPRDSQESSPTPQFKNISSSVLSFLYSPTFTCIHDYRKNHSFD